MHFKPRVEKLESMMVATVRAYGESPERAAWEKMAAWAGPKGLLDDLEAHPVFGFNNPNPSPDRREYGYEFWLVVDSAIEVGPDIELMEFVGGLYAVTSCNLSEEMSSAFFQREGYLESWKKLRDWVAESKYKPGSHQALEKLQDPMAPETEMVLDLYYPIQA